MKPKPDAHHYYRQLNHAEAQRKAYEKAKEARELLKDKIGLSDQNRIMASKSDAPSARR